jgi:hypothetical protein
MIQWQQEISTKESAQAIPERPKMLGQSLSDESCSGNP